MEGSISKTNINKKLGFLIQAYGVVPVLKTSCLQNIVYICNDINLCSHRVGLDRIEVLLSQLFHNSFTGNVIVYLKHYSTNPLLSVYTYEENARNKERNGGEQHLSHTFSLSELN